MREDGARGEQGEGVEEAGVAAAGAMTGRREIGKHRLHQRALRRVLRDVCLDRQLLLTRQIA